MAKKKLERHFTGGTLKGISIPETFHKKPIKVKKTFGSPYVVRAVKRKKK